MSVDGVDRVVEEAVEAGALAVEVEDHDRAPAGGGLDLPPEAGIEIRQALEAEGTAEAAGRYPAATQRITESRAQSTMVTSSSPCSLM